jgi:hypothetical protein
MLFQTILNRECLIQPFACANFTVGFAEMRLN